MWFAYDDVPVDAERHQYIYVSESKYSAAKSIDNTAYVTKKPSLGKC